MNKDVNSLAIEYAKRDVEMTTSLYKHCYSYSCKVVKVDRDIKGLFQAIKELIKAYRKGYDIKFHIHIHHK